MSAPLPDQSRKPPRPSLSPIILASSGPSQGPHSASFQSHSRSPSVVGPLGSAASLGRAEARRIHSHAEFGKYTEKDDEDYEDVFGKPNGSGESNV